MPTRFRRSVKLAPGVRLNVGKKGVTSVSFGGKGLRHTAGTGGRRRTSVGAPGTGFSVYGTSSAKAQRSTSQRTAIPAGPPLKPGFLAKPVERRFYEGLEAYRRGNWIRLALRSNRPVQQARSSPARTSLEPSLPSSRTTTRRQPHCSNGSFKTLNCRTT